MNWALNDGPSVLRSPVNSSAYNSRQLLAAATAADSTKFEMNLSNKLKNKKIELKVSTAEPRKFEARQLLKEKKFWISSLLIVWAAGLQGHMMWVQRQEAFKQKFGNVNPEADSEEAVGKQ